MSGGQELCPPDIFKQGKGGRRVNGVRVIDKKQSSWISLPHYLNYLIKSYNSSYHFATKYLDRALLAFFIPF